MNKTIARCTIIASVAVWLILLFIAPHVLSDKNSFLSGFVNHQLLAFLGVVVTITLASIANLHIELNKLETKVKKRVFIKTRTSIKQSASWLIAMLVIAFIIVIAKPMMNATDTVQSFFNGSAILVVIFNVLILIDITQTFFAIEPSIED